MASITQRYFALQGKLYEIKVEFFATFEVPPLLNPSIGRGEGWVWAFSGAVYIFQKVECIQMQKLMYGYAEMYFIEKVMTSQILYYVITFLVMQITANPYVSFCI